MTFFGSNSTRPGARDFSRPARPGAKPEEQAEEAASPAFPAPERPDPFNLQTPMPRQGPTPAESCPNVIATGSRWKGNLTIEDSVRVDGQMSGEIEAKGTVHIAESAVVDAKIHAQYVVVSGRFSGEIRCRERLELMPKSRVRGELVTKLLTVHEGAVIDGRIQMTTEEGVAARPARVGAERATAASTETKAPGTPATPTSPTAAGESKLNSTGVSSVNPPQG